MKKRSDVRVELGALLSADLVTAKALAQAVFDYPIDDWGTKSPIVFIVPTGDDDSALSLRGTQRVYDFELHTLVVYSTEAVSSSGSTGVLDALADAVCLFIAANRTRDSFWTSLAQTAKSQVFAEVVSGVPYFHEIRPIRVNAY